MIYAIPKAGFHVAPSLAQAQEFTLYNTETKKIDEFTLPGKNRESIPQELMSRGVTMVLCGAVETSVDKALVQELHQKTIQVQPFYDEQIDTLIERIRWNALEEIKSDDLEHGKHSVSLQHGSGCCGGSNIDSLLQEMSYAVKDSLPFDPNILPKKPKK